MSLNGELKHMFGADVYAQAQGQGKNLLDSDDLIRRLSINAMQVSKLSGLPNLQRDFINSLPNNEKVELCRFLIK